MLSDFLPEADQEYFYNKGLEPEALEEKTPDGTHRRGLLFHDFIFESVSLFDIMSEGPTQCNRCDLLIIIPSGYSTTKLDSFYTIPHLRHRDGTEPINANSEQLLFGKSWQFWSRHLDDSEWRRGIDGLSTFISIIRSELKGA